MIEFSGLDTEEKRGEFLRSRGLHTDHLEAWKKSMQAGLVGPDDESKKASRAEISELKARNRELERDLRRKDRALAETTALLVVCTAAFDSSRRSRAAKAKT